MNLARQRQRLARLVRIRDRQRDLAAAALAASRQAHAEAIYEHDLAIRAVAELAPGSEIAPWELERLGDVVELTHERIEITARRVTERQHELREVAVAAERARVLHQRTDTQLRADLRRVEQREADDRIRPTRNGGLR